MSVHFAKESELERVNELRRQVNDIHVQGRPQTFKPGFPKELQDHIKTIWNDPEQRILVCERDGIVCGFAVLHHVIRPETPFMFERNELDIDELCVDQANRRSGVGTELFSSIRSYAQENGFSRIELNMWEFNRDALEFYESIGFKTYRRYLEMSV